MFANINLKTSMAEFNRAPPVCVMRILPQAPPTLIPSAKEYLTLASDRLISVDIPM